MNKLYKRRHQKIVLIIFCSVGVTFIIAARSIISVVLFMVTPLFLQFCLHGAIFSAFEKIKIILLYIASSKIYEEDI